MVLLSVGLGIQLMDLWIDTASSPPGLSTGGSCAGARTRTFGRGRQRCRRASNSVRPGRLRRPSLPLFGEMSMVEVLIVVAAPLRRQAWAVVIRPGLPGNAKEPRTWRGWGGDGRQPPDGFGIPGVVPRFAPSLRERRGSGHSGRPYNHIDKRPGFQVVLQW